MAHRNKTIRRMTPVAHKVAHLQQELDKISRRLGNLLDELQMVEIEAKVFRRQVEHQRCLALILT